MPHPMKYFCFLWVLGCIIQGVFLVPPQMVFIRTTHFEENSLARSSALYPGDWYPPKLHYINAISEMG